MAVIAVTPGVPLQNIAAEIVYSLQELGTAVCITPEVVKANLGFNALDQSNDFKLTAWLGAQEDHYNTVIYLVSALMSHFQQSLSFCTSFCLNENLVLRFVTTSLSLLIFHFIFHSAMTTGT